MHPTIHIWSLNITKAYYAIVFSMWLENEGDSLTFFSPCDTTMLTYTHTHTYTTCVLFDTVHASLHRLVLASHQVSICICIYLPIEFVMLTTTTLRKTKNGSLVYLSLHFLKTFKYSFFGPLSTLGLDGPITISECHDFISLASCM